MESKVKFTWQLGIAILGGLMCVGYIINFVSMSGYNRPALVYAWIGLLTALIFYNQHRKANARALAARDKKQTELEFEEWAAEERMKSEV